MLKITGAKIIKKHLGGFEPGDVVKMVACNDVVLIGHDGRFVLESGGNIWCGSSSHGANELATQIGKLTGIEVE